MWNHQHFTKIWETGLSLDIQIGARMPEPLLDTEPLFPPNVLATWNGPTDPGNPQNWSTKRKTWITAILSILTICYTLSSTSFSTMANVIMHEFQISYVAATLATSLFALGASFGSLFWGPLSERFGRRNPIIIGFAGFIIFHISSGAALNLSTLLLSRTLCGFFGTAPVIIAGGTLTDFWDSDHRGVPVTVFSAATFAGMTMGPILGAFVATSPLGWRWTVWITMILSTGSFLPAFFLLPESYKPLIFQQRARGIRFRDRNWAFHAALDEQRLSLREVWSSYILRPFNLLYREIILLLTSIYLTFLYSLLYLLFEAYPIAFFEMREWPSLGVATLPLLSVALGVCMGGLLILWDTNARFRYKIRNHFQRSGTHSPSFLIYHRLAEERLPPMVGGGVVLSFGLFWFAATSSPKLTWVPQGIAGIFIGCGIFLIHLPGFNYILDVYYQSANSAIAAVISFRSLAAAITPLFAQPMFHALGVGWASALLGFVGLALIPVPICFHRWGWKIRARDSTVLVPLEQIHPALRSPISVPSLSLNLEDLGLEVPPPVWHGGRG